MDRREPFCDSHIFSIFSSYVQTVRANKMQGKLVNILRNLMTWNDKAIIAETHLSFIFR